MNEIFGAVIGDIIGSTYEVIEANALMHGLKVPYGQRIKILNPNTPLFDKESQITDDTFLTCAIAKAILYGGDYEKYLKYFGKMEINKGLEKFGRSRFGSGFEKWCTGESDKPSFGNGCAMRVSPIGLAFDSLEKTLLEAEKSAKPTHNLEESIKLTRAVAGSIYLARTKATKAQIAKFIENEIGYPLKFDIKYLQRNYIFTSKAKNSIPQALYCFLVSKNFEHCARLSVSIGGDTDTIAAIACSVAGAYYGVPDEILTQAKKYISKEYLSILKEFNQKF